MFVGIAPFADEIRSYNAGFNRRGRLLLDGSPCNLRGTFVTSPLFSSAEFQVKTNEDIYSEAE